MTMSLRFVLLLLVISFFSFYPGVTSIPVTNGDEAHFAQASKQMIETGDYLKINFQKKPRHLKPPGIYWLQSGITKVSQAVPYNKIFSYRLPSLFSAIAVVLLLYFIFSSMVGCSAALLASLILSITLLMKFEASFATTDATLCLSIYLMQAALCKIYLNDRKKAVWPIIFWLALSASIIIKGVGPLFALSTIIALYVFDRDARWLKRLYAPIGIPFVVIVTLAWLIPFSQSGQSNFLWDMIHGDVLPKLVGGQQKHGQVPGYYLMLLPILFWPMSLYLVDTGVFAFKHRKQAIIRFLIAWILPSWLIFECLPTKLPHYVLPVFPAIALLVAICITQAECHRDKATLILASVIWFLYNALFAGVFVAFYFMFHASGMVVAMLVGIVLLNAFISYYGYLKDKNRIAIVSSIIAGVLLYTLVFDNLLPNTTSLWITRNVATIIEKSHSHPRVLLSSGLDEPSLVFSLGTTQVRLLSFEELEKSISHASPLALINSDNLKKLKSFASKRKFKLMIIDTIRGFDYNHGHWKQLILLKKID